MEKDIKVRIENKSSSPDLQWEEGEREETERRILSLSDKDLGAFVMLLIKFDKEDLESVVREIKDKGHDSIHLETVMSEASSKDLLLWWLHYFEA